MTSWRCRTPLFLCVFLSTILQSEADCLSFNSNETMGQTYGIKNTTNIKDMMECSARQICRDTEDKLICPVLICGYNNKEDPQKDSRDITDECKKASVYQNFSYYDFMCLLAKDIGSVPPRGFCQYEAVLELYSKITASKTTTTLPPPTTTTTTLPPPPTTTTMPPPTTTLSPPPPPTTTTLPPPPPPPPPPTTTTTTTTLPPPPPPTATTTTLPPPPPPPPTTTTLPPPPPPPPTTTTTLPERTTTTPTTVLSNTALTLVSSSSSSSTLAPNVTSSPIEGTTDPGSAESVKLEGPGRECVTLKGLLVISLALNFLLPLSVFLFMHRRQKQKLRDLVRGSAEGNSARARVEIMSETQPASGRNSPKLSDRESSLELLANINMDNEAVGEETEA